MLIRFLKQVAIIAIGVSFFFIIDVHARPDCDRTPNAPICQGGDLDNPPKPPNNPPQPPNNPPISLQIKEGDLYRESNQPEVYVIHDGKKIWIPTPDALFAMGYDWSKVNVVPDGSLNGFARFNIPSSSPTPGSLVFPPMPNHFPLTGIANATKVFSQGREIQIVELYGWLRHVEGCNVKEGDGADLHYALELDTGWAASKGIDLNRILRVGNLAFMGIPQPATVYDPGLSARNIMGIPIIHVELNSWGWRSRYPSQKPQDWSHQMPEFCDKSVFWPFNPYKPDASKPGIGLQEDSNIRGPYVRMSGSLVTESPHDVQGRPGTFFCRHFRINCEAENFEWEGSVPDWNPGLDHENPEHYARWTEMHPPDLIEVLDWKEPKETVRGVALAARTGVFEGTCEHVEFDIFPEAPRPALSKIAFQELIGPETYIPVKNSDNGSKVAVFDDHIHVRVKVCGQGLGGSPGRFKAIYRVWWEEAARVPVVISKNRMQAEQILRDAHLIANFNGVGEWVLSQSPKAGTVVSRNAVIKLQLGDLNQIVVPDVVFLDSWDAEEVIRDAGLVPEIIGQGTRVVKQSPLAHKVVNFGTKVKLHVSSKPKKLIPPKLFQDQE